MRHLHEAFMNIPDWLVLGLVAVALALSASPLIFMAVGLI